jgi:polysaccharide export outer membrane protein
LRKVIRVVLVTLFLCVVNIEIGIGEEYLVGPGDVISISVYDNDDLTTRVMVNGNGQIVMPLLGQVKVGNLSIPGITKEITDLLADGYIINPQVNVFIEEYRSKKVVILGRVRKPGLIELSGEISFLELISKAGGLAPDAGDTATIKRTEGDGNNNKVILVDLLALIEKGDITQNVQIMDGDTVNVSKAGMCFVTGQVNSPGTYPCGDGSTVLKIIALSGGFNGKASKSSVRIVRIVNGVQKLMKDVALDTRLRQDDVIVVPESFF